MIGLLHRLAARAAGTTVAVRSDAYLPFGGRSPGFAAAFSVSDRSSALGERASAPMVPIAAAPPAVAPAALPPLAVETAPSVVSNPGRGPLVSSPDAAPPLKATAVPPRMVEMTFDEGRADPARTPPASRPLPSSSPARGFDAEDRDHGVRVFRDPPLLIPRGVPDWTPAPGAVAIAPTPARSLPAQLGGGSEPGDVHIHIGRVEVTAVHEAPALRRQPMQAKPPMSLDAYLASRGRG